MLCDGDVSVYYNGLNPGHVREYPSLRLRIFCWQWDSIEVNSVTSLVNVPQILSKKRDGLAYENCLTKRMRTPL